MVHSGPGWWNGGEEMRTLETVKRGAPHRGISPDVAATAEVLRALYLPSECRHLVELLRDEAPAPGDSRPPAADSRPPMSDAAFLDTVQALFADDGTPGA